MLRRKLELTSPEQVVLNCNGGSCLQIGANVVSVESLNFVNGQAAVTIESGATNARFFECDWRGHTGSLQSVGAAVVMGCSSSASYLSCSWVDNNSTGLSFAECAL